MRWVVSTLKKNYMNFQELSEKEILDIANPIMDNLMSASTEIDHKRHVRDFTERLRNLVTKEYLEKICREYQKEKGFFTERKVVAIFKRPKSVAIVWKQFFSKAKGEYIAEMVLIEKNDKFLVDHVMVL